MFSICKSELKKVQLSSSVSFLEKVHDWRIIGGNKFPYKENYPISNILKFKK